MRRFLPLLVLFTATLFQVRTPISIASADDRFEAVDARLTSMREKLIEVRRDLHQHAEAAGQEERTAAIVADWLRDHGLEVTTGVGGHGVVGLLEGAKPGPVIAYRADMDAMATPAMDPTPFKSENPQVNHVCGHDIHTTIAMGMAAALAPERERLAGTVKFVFQPAEEVAKGAQAMIDDGVMENPAPDAFLALHSSPVPVGQMLLLDGMALPGLEIFEVRISGSGDHDAAANQVVGIIMGVTTTVPPASTQFEAMLVPPASSYALGQVMSGEPDPKTGDLVVTAFFKASDDEAYAQARAKVRSGLEALESDELSFEVAFELGGLPPMVNDLELGARSLLSARSALGTENVLHTEGSIPFFGEDFAFFQERVPGVLYFLGVANPAKGINGMPHAPNFQADEDAILVGARAMSAVLLDYLGEN